MGAICIHTTTSSLRDEEKAMMGHKDGSSGRGLIYIFRIKELSSLTFLLKDKVKQNLNMSKTYTQVKRWLRTCIYQCQIVVIDSGNWLATVHIRHMKQFIGLLSHLSNETYPMLAQWQNFRIWVFSLFTSWELPLYHRLVHFISTTTLSSLQNPETIIPRGENLSHSLPEDPTQTLPRFLSPIHGLSCPNAKGTVFISWLVKLTKIVFSLLTIGLTLRDVQALCTFRHTEMPNDI